MTPPRPTHGVVSLPALDLRLEPSHRAELGSQLLLGEVVGRLSANRDGTWWRVESLTDGYRGWVRAWGIVPASAARAKRWSAAATGTVAQPVIHASARRDGGIAVGPLFLGGRVIPGAVSGTRRRIELPDARRGWVDRKAIALKGEAPPALKIRVESLMGTPYLWGGRTPAGFDCSSFVQTVLAEQGARLPRDAHDQFLGSRPLPRGDAPRPGDLVFFSRSLDDRMEHVGLGLGGDWYAHCRGRVRLSSLDRDNPLCDNEILGQFRGWRRVKQLS